jgi:hypothetical protein
MHVIGTSPDQASSRRSSLGSLNSTQKQRRQWRNGRGIAQSTRKTTLRPITSPSRIARSIRTQVLAILRAALLYLLAPAGRRTLHHALADHIWWNTARSACRLDVRRYGPRRQGAASETSYGAGFCRAAPLDGIGGSCTWRGAVKTAGLPGCAENGIMCRIEPAGERLYDPRAEVEHSLRRMKPCSVGDDGRGGASLRPQARTSGRVRREQRRHVRPRPDDHPPGARAERGPDEPMPRSMTPERGPRPDRGERARALLAASSPGTRTGTAPSPACARRCWPRRDVLHRRSRDVRELSAG